MTPKKIVFVLLPQVVDVVFVDECGMRLRVRKILEVIAVAHVLILVVRSHSYVIALGNIQNCSKEYSRHSEVLRSSCVL